eukprot:5972951-Prymnesium_polylepis.1
MPDQWNQLAALKTRTVKSGAAAACSVLAVTMTVAVALSLESAFEETLHAKKRISGADRRFRFVHFLRLIPKLRAPARYLLLEVTGQGAGGYNTRVPAVLRAPRVKDYAR